MAYTSAQIVSMACQISKAPGFTTQAGQFLNMILADLAQTYDFDFLRKTTTLNISAAPALTPYALPTDYLRAREVFYNINGAVTFIDQIPLEDFDKAYAGAGLNDYPMNFATDVAASPVNMYFWPNPSVSLAVTVRYQPQPSDITTPETNNTAPWFPNQRYLLTKLCSDLMTLTDDDRQSKFRIDAEEMLKLYMSLADDNEGYAQQVKLDSRSFKGRGSGKATKNQPL